MFITNLCEEELMTKISIIIPVYNTANLLPRCIDSVLKQSYSDYEVICVNDGSTDNSAEVLEKYAHKDNFKIISQNNKGLGAARNTGMDASDGEYTLFLDSDDFLPAEALETFVKIADASSADVVVSTNFLHLKPGSDGSDNHIFNNRVKWKLHTSPLADLIKDKKSASNACNKFYKTEVIKNHRFIEGIYYEDWPFITTLFGQIKSYASTQTPLYFYDMRFPSITRSKFSIRKIESYISGIRYVYNFYKNTKYIKLAETRNIRALSMCLNKIYHSKDKDLIHYLHSQILSLWQEKIITISRLPIKALFRLWKMGIIGFVIKPQLWQVKPIKGESNE